MKQLHNELLPLLRGLAPPISTIAIPLRGQRPQGCSPQVARYWCTWNEASGRTPADANVSPPRAFVRDSGGIRGSRIEHNPYPGPWGSQPLPRPKEPCKIEARTPLGQSNSVQAEGLLG